MGKVSLTYNAPKPPNKVLKVNRCLQAREIRNVLGAQQAHQRLREASILFDTTQTSLGYTDRQRQGETESKYVRSEHSATR
jgi:hypothetical protein